MMANLSYELDLSLMTAVEKQDVTRQIKLYKDIRQDIQFGKMYRLQSPYSKASIGNDSEGSVVLIESVDQESYYLFIHKGLMKPSRTHEFVKTHYLGDGSYTLYCANELFNSVVMVNGANGPEEVVIESGTGPDGKGIKKEYDLSDSKSLVSQLTPMGIYDASYLNHRGISIPASTKDFESHMFILKKESN